MGIEISTHRANQLPTTSDTTPAAEVAEGSSLPAAVSSLTRPATANADARRTLPEATPLDRRSGSALDGDSIGNTGFASKGKALAGKITSFVANGVSSAWKSLRSGSATAAARPFAPSDLIGDRTVQFSREVKADMAKLIQPETQKILPNGAHAAFDKDISRCPYTLGGDHLGKAKNDGDTDGNGKQAFFDKLVSVSGGDTSLATKLSGLANQAVGADGVAAIMNEFGGVLQMEESSIQVFVDRNTDGSFSVRLDQTALPKQFAELTQMGSEMHHFEEPFYFSSRMQVTMSADGSSIEVAPFQFSVSEEPDLKFYEKRYGSVLSTSQQRLYGMCDPNEVELGDFVKACAEGVIDDATADRLRASGQITSQVASMI